MTPQQKVNELARKLVDDVNSLNPLKSSYSIAKELKEALNELPDSGPWHYKTEGGLDATVFMKDARNDFPWKGVLHKENEDCTCSWKNDGTYHVRGKDPNNLIIEPEQPKSIPNNPPPVEAKIGCWTTRDGSKAVVYGKRPDQVIWNFSGKVFICDSWHTRQWNEHGKSAWNSEEDNLLTFISPDVEYWNKVQMQLPPSTTLTAGYKLEKQVDLGKEPKFDPSQLPVSFVVKFTDGKEEGHYTPLRVKEDGLVLHSGEITAFYSWKNLASGIALWSTDRKTWREFR